jgi:hypothetical protein
MNYIALTGSDMHALATAAEILLEQLVAAGIAAAVLLYVNDVEQAVAIRATLRAGNVGELWRRIRFASPGARPAGRRAPGAGRWPLRQCRIARLRAATANAAGPRFFPSSPGELAMREYRPPAGSTAEAVVAYLKKNGGTLDGEQIAKKFGGVARNVSTCLRKAVEADLLVAEREGQRYVWSLPANQPTAEADDEPLEIANYNDGDVVVLGGTQNENGSVTYSRKQVEQFIDHLTRPHVVLPAPKESANV